MTTFTTDITAPPVRSRAARIAEGVIAKYIQELNAAAKRSTRAQMAERTDSTIVFATSSAPADETAADASASLARDEAGLSKRSSCWSRGGRSTRSTLAQRLTETR